MLTEQFINLCCVILFDESQKVTQNVLSEINYIINSYNEEDVALPLRKKVELVKTISKLRNEKKSTDQILDDIISGGHFTELDSYIKSLENRKLTLDKLDSALEQVSKKKQFTSVLQDIPQLENFIQKIHTNGFSDLGEAVDYWDKILSKMHSRSLEEKRKNSRMAIKELDLVSDDYDNVLDQISISYSGQNSISTGFSELDKYMNGGFEPARLYIYGGTSGDGKSVLLNNFVKNAVEKNKDLTGPWNIFTYFTMENLIDESLVRLYCSITNEKVSDFIKTFAEKRLTIQKTIKEWSLDHNAIIVMSYFPATITSVSDLVAYNDIIKHRYIDEKVAGKKGVLRANYVDYLDLLKSGQIFDLHRLEMGQVTIDMKVAAVLQGIPWITVSQLNRSISINSRINIKDSGNTEFKNVKIGDEIENDTGFVKVKQIFPREIKKCYKITTKSGKIIVCGPKHNFPTTDGLKNIQYTGLKVGDKLYVKTKTNNDRKIS